MQLAVGRVVKPHGVGGELLVEVRTDEPEQRFAVGRTLGVEPPTGQPAIGRPGSVTVCAVRTHSGRLIVRFEGITDRSAADSLRGAMLTVDSAALPEPADPEEFYDHQLVGMTVELADGSTVGTVTDVVHGPAGELLVVGREGRDDALIPFVRAIVPTVNAPARRIVLDPPEGLL